MSGDRCCHRLPWFFPSCPWCALARIEESLHRLETKMAKATDQLTNLNNKLDTVTSMTADLMADVRAALVTINADELSPTAQAQVDQILPKIDAFTQNLRALDVEVGDRDGSDTPPVEPVEDEPAEEPFSNR